MADRLSLAHAIENAGIERGVAEQIAVEIDELVHDNVATKTDIALLRTELKGDLRELELRLERQIDRMITRLGALVVVVAGLLFGALHYWPPHG